MEKKLHTHKKKLQSTLENPTYSGSKEAIERVREELAIINELAVRSLDEGIDEILTLHKLGMFEKLNRSPKTTNAFLKPYQIRVLRRGGEE